MDAMNVNHAENQGGAYLRTANSFPTASEERIRERASTLSWQLLLCIAALTLLVRVACMIIFESWNFKHEWAFGHEMGRIGQWLAQGEGFTLDGNSPTATFPPLYPLLVGAFFYIFGVYSKAAAVALFLFQSVCSMAIAVCLANLGKRLFGRTTGIIAALVWAFYPTSIFYSAVRIWYCELALLFVLLVVTIVVTTKPPPSFSRVVFLGVLSGITVLTDSTMALYLPLLFLWMLFAWRVKLSKLIILVAVWGITAGVVVSPWMARNWLVLGSPVLLKSNFGQQLFVQNSSQATWTEAREKLRTLKKEGVAAGGNSLEVASSRYLGNKALDWIRENPFEFVSATVRRIFWFWVVNPEQGWESWLRLTFFAPLIVLALYGLRYAGSRWWQLAPVWLFLLIYPLPYYVTHVHHGRYSYPVEPFVVLLASIPLAVWFGRYSRALFYQYADGNKRLVTVKVNRNS
jgi:4-amino-4-deoxy-L-arabinose transferase-like glycosyltransferase